MDDKKIEQLIEIANKKYDGHFTLMKFTTNWGCCFGTIMHPLETHQMAKGKTMEEAIEKCIAENINVYDFDRTGWE